MYRMNLSLSEEANKYLNIIANDQCRSKTSVIKMALSEFIEDYLDSKKADEAYEEWLSTGKKTYTLEEVCKENGIKLEN